MPIEASQSDAYDATSKLPGAFLARRVCDMLNHRGGWDGGDA